MSRTRTLRLTVPEVKEEGTCVGVTVKEEVKETKSRQKGEHVW